MPCAPAPLQLQKTPSPPSRPREQATPLVNSQSCRRYWRYACAGESAHVTTVHLAIMPSSCMLASTNSRAERHPNFKALSRIPRFWPAKPPTGVFHNPNRCHRLPRPVVVLDPVYSGKASCPDFPHGTPYACCRLPRPVAVCWSLCTVAGFAAPGLATPSPFCFPTLISIFIHIHSFHCRWPKPVVLHTCVGPFVQWQGSALQLWGSNPSQTC